jgi:hypothetical protein
LFALRGGVRGVAAVFHVVGLAGTRESRWGPPLDVSVNMALSLQDETDIDLAPFDVSAVLKAALASWKKRNQVNRI